MFAFDVWSLGVRAVQKRDRYEERLHQLWVGEQDTTERLELLRNMRVDHPRFVLR